MPPEVAPLSSQSRAASSPLGSTERAHDPEFETLQFTGPEAEQSTLENSDKKKTSAYAGLGWLDRLLVLWILLAIVIGILLGNFVDSVGPALQRGKFVDVSVPIGTHSKAYGLISKTCLTLISSGTPPHDVPYPMQGPIRDFASSLRPSSDLGAAGVQYRCELDYRPLTDGKHIQQ